ncbi:DUF881 domain-containing protein [Wenjunlia vitaminophila]|uniref:DUF881 domain-containing protein n=1 Tax=Wenjunlia vitaminophila TaxID=76728 RepID=UPI00099688A1
MPTVTAQRDAGAQGSRGERPAAVSSAYRTGDSPERRNAAPSGARPSDQVTEERPRAQSPAEPAGEATPAGSASREGSDAPEVAPSTGGTGAGPTGRQRLAAALWPPRASRAQFIVALLLFALGLGLAIQVRSNTDESRLRGARQEDLVRILDELDSRNKRLQEEKRDLEQQRTELENSSDQAEEARRQTEKRTAQLGVLAGTVAARGPGITLTINDPGGHVRADMLLDTLQELRAAGAEAIQINEVRVVADTFFSEDLSREGANAVVEIDGHRVEQPYRFEVIGNPQDLEPALNIPGGVVQSMEREQATVSVVRSEKIVVDALRQANQPDYARSAPE